MGSTFINVGNSVQEESVQENKKYFEIENLLGEIPEVFPDDFEDKKLELRTNIGAISMEDLFKPEDLDLNFEDSDETRPLYLVIKRIILENLDKTNLPDDLIDQDTLDRTIKDTLTGYYKLGSEGIFKNAIIENILNKTEIRLYDNNEYVAKVAIIDAINKSKESIDSEIKKWVNRELELYLKTSDFNNLVSKYINLNVEPSINSIKTGYAKLNKEDLKFLKPIASVEPTLASHLVTRRYVDKSISEHKAKDDHGLKAWVENKLKSYIQEGLVYNIGETYNRSQIHSLLNTSAEDAVQTYLKKYRIPNFDDITKVEENIYLEHYVKQNNKETPFLHPQKGKDAENDDELVTLGLVNKAIESVKNSIETLECYWITSGPVETTVGFLEDNTCVPKKMTIQEVLDRIFYEKKIKIEVPETSKVGSYVDVTVCISDPYEIDGAEIFYRTVGDEEWLTKKGLYIEREEFEESLCVTKTIGPIYDDTEFDFRIYYSNGFEGNEYAKTKLSYPVFAGIIPRWMVKDNIDYSDLIEFSEKDPINNQFYDKTEHMRELEHSYNFDLEKPVKLIVAVPKNYRDLNKVQNDVLTFKVDEFDKVLLTTFLVSGKKVLYKLYIYKQPLVSFNSDVIFKFL